MSADASISVIEEAVTREYGDQLHEAMRGPSGNLRYFRQAVHSLLPLLLPSDVLTSKSDTLANYSPLPMINIIYKINVALSLIKVIFPGSHSLPFSPCPPLPKKIHYKLANITHFPLCPLPPPPKMCQLVVILHLLPRQVYVRVH